MSSALTALIEAGICTILCARLVAVTTTSSRESVVTLLFEVLVFEVWVFEICADWAWLWLANAHAVVEASSTLTTVATRIDVPPL
jgi:hypothetical protein